MFPANKNYTLPSGEIWFARFDEGTRVSSEGRRYLGNTPEFSITSSSDSLDHFDADGPSRVKDDSALLELTRTGALVTDHVSPENLALLFGGVAEVIEQTAITDATQTVNNVYRSRMYQIGKTPANPTGVRGLSTVTVATAGGSSTPLVANVDYRVDMQTGTLVILPGSTVITADGTTNITITYAGSATQYHQVRSGSAGQVEGELFYKAMQNKGAKFDYLFPYVVLRPDGDFNLKTDGEWQQIPFAIEILKLDDSTESVYTSGRPGIYV